MHSAIVWRTCLITFIVSVPVCASIWDLDGSGQWNSNESWLDGIPNSAAAMANFGPRLPNRRSTEIDVSTDVTIGKFSVSVPSRITVDGDGSISVSGQSEPSFSIGGEIRSSVSIRVPVTFQGEAHRIEVNQDISTLRLDGPLFASDVALTKDGTGQLVFGGDLAGFSGQLLVEQGVARFESVPTFPIRILGGQLELATGAAPVGIPIQFDGGSLRTRTHAVLNGTLGFTAGRDARFTPGDNGLIEIIGATTGAGRLVLDGPGTVDVRAGLTHTGGVSILDGTMTLYVPFSQTGKTLVSGGSLVIEETGALAGVGAIDVQQRGRIVVARPTATPPSRIRLTQGAIALAEDIDPFPMIAPDSVEGVVELVNISNFTAGGILAFDFGAGGSGIRLAAGGNASIAPATQLIPSDDGTLRFGGAEGTLSVNNVIADTNTPTGVDQAVSGTTRLFGNNTYGGDTFVRGGTLVVEHPNALGRISSGTFVEGGSLVINVATPEPITLRAGGSLQVNAVDTTSGLLTIEGGSVSLGTYPKQVTMRGGLWEVQSAETPFDLPVAVKLDGGESTFRFPGQSERTSKFDVVGAGDLVVDISSGTSRVTITDSNWTQTGSVTFSGAGNTFVDLNGALDYAGDTIIHGPQVYLNDPNGLGAGETVIRSGSLTLNVATENRLHVTGTGDLLLTEESGVHDAPIAMSGGDLFPWPNRELAAPIEMREGELPSTIYARSTVLTGGSYGSGNLRWIGNGSENNIDGLPLTHNGELQIEGLTNLNTENRHTGQTVVSGGATTLNHVGGLGISELPTRVERDGQLLLNVAPPNDIIVTNATVEFRETASDYTGTITLATGSGNSPPALRVMGEFYGTVNATGATGNILRGGKFFGNIVGDGEIAFVSALPGNDLVELNAANTFTNLARVSVGTVDLNHPDGLGSARRGTIVGNGTLNIRANTQEALTLQGYGTINLYEQLSRLPISVPGSGGTIGVHVPSEYENTVDLFDATLEIEADTTIGALTFWGDSGVVVAPGSRLRVLGDSLDIVAGRIAGEFETDGPLRKYGSSIADLGAVSGFSGDIEVHGGILVPSPTPVGGSASSIGLKSSQFAAVELKAGQSVRYGQNLSLNGARGYGTGPALRTRVGFNENTARLTGDLDIGMGGASIGALQGATLEFTGQVSGGELSIVSGTIAFLSEVRDLGDIHIRDATLALADAGAIQSGAEIHLYGNGFLSSIYTNGLDRYGDTSKIVSHGGSMSLSNSSGMPPTEIMGPFVLSSGYTEVSADRVRGVFGSLERLPGATVFFNLQNGGSIDFDQAPRLENGIIGGWAVIRDQDTNNNLVTVGPNGLRKLDAYTTDLSTVGPGDNFRVGSATVTSDLHVNSVSPGSSDTLDLRGNTLVVESGAVLARVINGRITAGVEHATLYGFGQNAFENVSIVDNGDVPVSVVVSSGGLAGTNTYSGKTIIVGQVRLLSPNAIPENSELILDGGELIVYEAPERPLYLRSFVLKGSSETLGRGGLLKLDVDEIRLEHGEIGGALEFVGDGTMIKETPGRVVLNNLNPNFSGQVVVRDGYLTGSDFGSAKIRVENGVFATWWSADPLTNVIDLAGGDLGARSGQFAGPINVLAAATIVNEAGGHLSGSLSGTMPLTFESIVDGESVLRVSGDNAAYSGSVVINSGTVRVESTLGSGQITLNTGGTVELANRNATVENDFVLRGGTLLSREDPAIVSGRVNIETTAAVGSTLNGLGLSLRGGVEMADRSRLYKIGNSELEILDEIGVSGLATMVIPSGNAKLSGAVVARTENATLDIVGLGFEELSLSL